MAGELNQILGKDMFLLDGAATTHMVDNWIQLQNEKPIDIIVKGLGNMKATSRGVLTVQGMVMGTALRVPGLGANLISEGVLQSNGCEIISKGKWRKVIYKRKVIISALLENGLFIWKPKDESILKQFKTVTGAEAKSSFPIQLTNLDERPNVMNQECFASIVGSRPESALQLWHLRMGHLNVADLHILKTRSTGINNLSGGDLQMCTSCCRAKASQRSFSGQGDKANRPLQTIFVDLWGPMKPSLEGATYAMLIVDDFTSYTWGFYLQHKSQAADYIIQFVKENERAGRQIEKVRSDRGGEFTSNILKEFFQSVGIIHAHSPPYTPQFQGKVERMNRTVGEMAHAMRIGANLDVEFWALAWAAACF